MSATGVAVRAMVARAMSVVFSLCLAMFIFPTQAPVAGEGSTDSCGEGFARLRELLPDLTWQALNVGLRLHPHDAVHVCDSSAVTVQVTHPLRAAAPHLHLKRVGRLYVGVIGAGIVWVPGAELRNPIPSSFAVDVINVRGSALYSGDHAAIKRYGLWLLDFLKTTIKEQDIGRALHSMSWRVLTSDRVLVPWDMLWVRPSGRIEVAITKNGPIRLIDRETDVIDATGGVSGKKRFPENVFFVMVPEHFIEGRVKKMIGEVWIASDRSRAQAFVARYRMIFGGSGEPLVPGSWEKWRETLLKPELE